MRKKIRFRRLLRQLEQGGKCMVRVALNGPGRTGKSFIWSWAQKKKAGQTDIDIVAINGVRDVDKDGLRFFVELLKFDSAHGRKFDSIAYGKNEDGTGWIELFGQCIPVYNVRDDLTKLPWTQLGVDVVIESTGRLRKREHAQAHLTAGAKKVIVSAPGKELDASMVLGTTSIPVGARIIDCASCTTNAITGVVSALHKKFRIKHGSILTVHAPTDNQNLLDGSHSDMRRARSALNNIIPTTTGAAKAVVKALPELQGKLHASAFRVGGCLTGSIVGIVAEVEQATSKDEVNAYLKDLCARPVTEGGLQGVHAVDESDLVSSHIIGRTESGIIDAPITEVVNGSQVSVWSWYDNEFGYSSRLVDVASLFGKMN